MKAGQRNSDLAKQAKMVLDFNWTGEYTRPGPRLYPHQWSWDSALVAIGYARYDSERAVRELSHLFGAQWKNGLLPQIVFNPGFSDYFPNAGFWHADESPDAPAHVKTSGIVQPPIHATAALQVYRKVEGRDKALAFLKSAFGHLRDWHDYLIASATQTARDSCTYGTHGRAAWTTPRCGTWQCRPYS